MNSTPTLDEPALFSVDEAVGVTRAVATTQRPAWLRGVEAALLVVAAIFLALYFVHLRADFPNHSPWMDWSKYTDEGWYGDAAIRHYQWGHWNVPGDFNPAAALPVWPVLEMALFRVTGVSLVAARALTVVVFGLSLVCCYWLVRRWSNTANAGALRRRSLAGAIAVVLLAVSPFCFAFMRLAILEPLLILLTLAAMLAATGAGRERGSLRWAVALGSMLPLMVLTKTTGIFLFPAIFWLLWAASGYRVRTFLRAAVVAGGVGVAAWGGYFLLFVRPRYLMDYRYLFSANGYTGVTLGTAWSVLEDTVSDGRWIGTTLFALTVVATTGSLVGLCFRRTRVNPLVVALLLWIFGYGAFLAYHDNLQPRYYLVLAVPLTLLVAIVFDAVLAGALARGAGIGVWVLRGTAVVAGGALAFAAVHGACGTAGFVLHPEYGWVSAAEQVREVVEREASSPTHRDEAAMNGAPGHSRLVMSISGADLSLMTGLQSICDDFGTMELVDRVAAYRPGWFATWNDVEDDKMDALASRYRLVRVAAFPAFDDRERNLLILYRLDALGTPGRSGRTERRRSLAAQRRLRTKIGEQPSAAQLVH